MSTCFAQNLTVTYSNFTCVSKKAPNKKGLFLTALQEKTPKKQLFIDLWRCQVFTKYRSSYFTRQWGGKAPPLISPKLVKAVRGWPNQKECYIYIYIYVYPIPGTTTDTSKNYGQSRLLHPELMLKPTSQNGAPNAF